MCRSAGNPTIIYEIKTRIFQKQRKRRDVSAYCIENGTWFLELGPVDIQVSNGVRRSDDGVFLGPWLVATAIRRGDYEYREFIGFVFVARVVCSWYC